ncbi:hypothetical protein [Candidatus Reidiella endopervernicosa]|uniref:Uncharacterized protein n=1 Tax=Candidatus Reidiella endopervernicosa TaxID=2738883 RepID=A0A6N0HYA3_9GAMM|nr:hypothetical protein [Candidatus Reidiella endopervernicosa]QKQ27267.1 hypothetical protein HUE57_13970 [Candidatus Reidiella endopervernicosa]
MLVPLLIVVSSSSVYAKEDFFRDCIIQDVDETGMVRVFNRKPELIEYREAVVVAVSEGTTPEVVVRCDIGAVHEYFGKLPEGKHYDIRMSATGQLSRDVGGLSRKKAVIPVKSGMNEVTVTFQDANFPQVGSFSKRLSFYAFVYDIEPAGRLQSPIKDPKQNFIAFMTDRQGNIYGQLSHDRKKVLARFSPSGRLSAKYDLGKDDPKHGSRGYPRPLFVDSQGHLYAIWLGNIIEYNKSGAFIQSHGAFSYSRRFRTAADLNADAKPEMDRDQPPVWQEINKWIYHNPPIVIRDWVYFIAEARPPKGVSGSRLVVARFSPTESKLEIVAQVAGVGSDYTHAEGMVQASDGTLHVKVTGKNWLKAVISVAPGDGKVTLLRKLPAGNKLTSMDDKTLASGTRRSLLAGDRRGYYFHAKRVLRDFSYVASLGLESQHFRYSRPRAGRKLKEIDLLTGKAITSSRDKAWSKNFWFHRGSIYVSYMDMRIARFSLRGGGGGAPAPETIHVKKQELSPSFELVRSGATFEQGIVLDGATAVSMEVRFSDGEGEAVVGERVDLSFWERLPQKGELRFPNGQVTDGEGRMLVEYLPPRITQEVMQAGKWAPQVRFTARAKLKKQELVVQVKAGLLGLAELELQLERNGYAPQQSIPIALADINNGVVKGQVVYPVGKGVYGTVVMPEVLPINGLFIRLVDKEKRVLVEAQSNADGQFELIYGDPAKSVGPAEFVLSEPLKVSAYDKDTDYFVTNARAAVREMEKKHYGYQAGAIRQLLSTYFPMKIAAAANNAEVELHRNQLVRVGLLMAALREGDDLANHAAEQFADSLVNVMDGLANLANIDLFDDKKLKIDEMSKSAGFKAGNFALMGGKAIKGRVAQFVMAQLKKNFVSVMRGTVAHHKHVAWYWLKKILMKGVVDIAGKPWKGQLVTGLMGEDRKQAQTAITAAANAWGNGKISESGGSNLLIRNRYAEIAEFKRQVTNQQLDLELYKADIDLGFDVIGQGLVVIATIKGGAVAGERVAEGVKMVDKGFKVITTGAEAYTGFQWLRDYDNARASIAQFTRAVVGP